MSSYNGKVLQIKTYGSSHGDEIGAEVSGLKAFDIDYEKLARFMERRKPKTEVSTKRRENDEVDVIIENGEIAQVKIKNGDVKKSDYDYLYGKPRPSHADYAAYIKDGTLDFSGGGRFSGRMTAVYCALGGICLQYLESRGVHVAAYLKSAGGVEGLGYANTHLTTEEIVSMRGSRVPSLSENERIYEKIMQAKSSGDSVGGVVDCVVDGSIKGLGNDGFDGLEGKLSNLLFSIPAVKAVEFGLGKKLAYMTGSSANDQTYYKGDKVGFYANNDGGIYGGIAVGEPVNLSVAFKPTPSISIKQATVDLINKKNCEIEIVGRHDACVALRAVPVVESMVAIGLVDEILSEFKG